MGFFLAYRSWRSVRDFVVTADLRLLAAIQAWRFLGFGFVALHANGVLPGLFAWPAGIGDMAVAIAAPWIAVGLARRSDFLTMRRFKWWNWLGILDLILAVGTGALASGLVPGLVRDGITTAPMARLPLVLVPAFLVPLMIMSHAIGLLQARNVAERSRAI